MRQNNQSENMYHRRNLQSMGKERERTWDMGNTFQKTVVKPTKPMIALNVNRLNSTKSDSFQNGWNRKF